MSTEADKPAIDVNRLRFDVLHLIAAPGQDAGATIKAADDMVKFILNGKTPDTDTAA